MEKGLEHHILSVTLPHLQFAGSVSNPHEYLCQPRLNSEIVCLKHASELEKTREAEGDL